MNSNYFGSKPSPRNQQSFYPRVLLPRDSNRELTSPSVKRNYSKNATNESNCCTSPEYSFIKQSPSSLSSSSSKRKNNSSNISNLYFSRSVASPKDLSRYMPTLFNFQNQNQHLYYSTALRRRRIVYSNRPVPLTQTPVNSNVEHGLRVLESKKRAPNEMNQSLHSDSSNSDYENLLSGDLKRRRTITCTTRLSSCDPSLPRMNIAKLGCLNENEFGFSFTSIDDLKNKDLCFKSSQEHRTYEHLSSTSDALSQTSVSITVTSSITVVCSVVSTESSANSRTAISLRRKVPYMSPSELESYLLSKRAFCNYEQNQSNTDISDVFVDKIVDDLNPIVIVSSSSSSESLKTVGTQVVDVAPTLISDVSMNTANKSLMTFRNLEDATVTNKDNLSVATSVQSSSDEKMEKEHSSGDKFYRPSLVTFLADLDQQESERRRLVEIDSVTRNANVYQKEIDSRIKRIRNLLSSKSPKPQELSDFDKKSGPSFSSSNKLSKSDPVQFGLNFSTQQSIASIITNANNVTKSTELSGLVSSTNPIIQTSRTNSVSLTSTGNVQPSISSLSSSKSSIITSDSTGTVQFGSFSSNATSLSLNSNPTSEFSFAFEKKITDSAVSLTQTSITFGLSVSSTNQLATQSSITSVLTCTTAANTSMTPSFMFGSLTQAKESGSTLKFDQASSSNFSLLSTFVSTPNVTKLNEPKTTGIS